MNRIVPLTAVLGLLGCMGCDKGFDFVDAGRKDSGAGGGGAASELFTITTLDSTPSEPVALAMASDPANKRIGVVYYTPTGTMNDAGVPDYNLMYVEWKNGTIVVPPEKIRVMQRMAGLSATFGPTGDPVVAYLGGDKGFVVGMSIYWFQSDAAYATRVNGTWTETVVATTGDQVSCPDPTISDRGFLVGLWPSVIFDGPKMYFVYRDAHDGQFGSQDYGGSDVEIWSGTPGSLTGACAYSGAGTGKHGPGGHIQLAMANGKPAMVYDQMETTADGKGSSPLFQMMTGTGSWTAPSSPINSSDTMTGASLAWNAVEGYGIAVVERASNELKYVKSINGTAWTTPDPVFGAGTGGWWPNLAMDPMNNEPAIAFYICSPSTGKTDCRDDEDKLVVTQRIAGTWRNTDVDLEGGYSPKLTFFGEKRVMAYRHPKTGVLKLAVEK